MNKPQIILHIEKSIDFNSLDVKWIPKSAKIVSIGTPHKGTGLIQIHELTETDLSHVKNIERPKPLKCGTFGATCHEERFLATGDFDGNLEIHDLNYSNKPIYSVKAHSKIINTIDGVGGINIGKGAPELVTGSRDGCVKVWDPRQADPVVTIEPELDSEKRDCWAVCFGDAYSMDNRCVCAGFDNGDLKLFDLRTNSILWEDTLSNGICSVEFDRKDIEMNKLVVTTLESQFCVYDMRTFNKKTGYSSMRRKCHDSTIWCVRHLPQNRDLFFTTGGNGSLNLWRYIYPSKRSTKAKDGQLSGVMGELQDVNGVTFSSQPITSLDLNRDKTGLCVASSIDQTIKIIIVTKLNTL